MDLRPEHTMTVGDLMEKLRRQAEATPAIPVQHGYGAVGGVHAQEAYIRPKSAWWSGEYQEKPFEGSAAAAVQVAVLEPARHEDDQLSAEDLSDDLGRLPAQAIVVVKTANGFGAAAAATEMEIMLRPPAHGYSTNAVVIA